MAGKCMARIVMVCYDRDGNVTQTCRVWAEPITAARQAGMGLVEHPAGGWSEFVYV